MPSILKQVKKLFKSGKTSSTKATADPVDKTDTPATADVAPTTVQSSHPENTNSNHTFDALLKSDAQLAPLADHQYTKAASVERVNKTKASLEASGFKVHVVDSRGEAFETLKSLIPAGSSVNNAHSTTLEEIGFITYLKGDT